MYCMWWVDILVWNLGADKESTFSWTLTAVDWYLSVTVRCSGIEKGAELIQISLNSIIFTALLRLLSILIKCFFSAPPQAVPVRSHVFSTVFQLLCLPWYLSFKYVFSNWGYYQSRHLNILQNLFAEVSHL